MLARRGLTAVPEALRGLTSLRRLELKGNRLTTWRRGWATHSWMNGHGNLRCCTDRDSKVVGFYLCVAATFPTIRALIRQARAR